MSMHRLPCLLLLAGTLQAADAPSLGEPLAAAEADAIDFTVLPDGSGLPAGAGDVRRGGAVYAAHCLACHGDEGQGAGNDRLVGGIGTLASDTPVKTVGSYWPYATTVFDYVRRAMPYNAPGSLSNDEIYAVTAWLLYANGIVAEDFVAAADTLPGVEMPNRGNFDRAWPQATGDAQ